MNSCPECGSLENHIYSIPFANEIYYYCDACDAIWQTTFPDDETTAKVKQFIENIQNLNN